MEEAAKVKGSVTSVHVMGQVLPRSFFEAPPDKVAPRLLGKVLVHGTPHCVVAGRIVEVEAYLGPHNQPSDPAAHSHRGPTPRNQVLFGPAGHAYVYSIYGRHFCMNVSCEPEGRAGCVLVRALEPLEDPPRMARNRGLQRHITRSLLTSGPSRLCQALGLSRSSHNGLDLTSDTSPLRILDDDIVILEAQVTARIGIRHAAELPLRFAIPGHPCVSGPKNLPHRCVPIT